MAIFVTWQLIVTLDSILNSCDVWWRIPLSAIQYKVFEQILLESFEKITQIILSSCILFSSVKYDGQIRKFGVIKYEFRTMHSCVINVSASSLLFGADMGHILLTLHGY